MSNQYCVLISQKAIFNNSKRKAPIGLKLELEVSKHLYKQPTTKKGYFSISRYSDFHKTISNYFYFINHPVLFYLGTVKSTWEGEKSHKTALRSNLKWFFWYYFREGFNANDLGKTFFKRYWFSTRAYKTNFSRAPPTKNRINVVYSVTHDVMTVQTCMSRKFVIWPTTKREVKTFFLQNHQIFYLFYKKKREMFKCV